MPVYLVREADYYLIPAESEEEAIRLFESASDVGQWYSGTDQPMVVDTEDDTDSGE